MVDWGDFCRSLPFSLAGSLIHLLGTGFSDVDSLRNGRFLLLLAFRKEFLRFNCCCCFFNFTCVQGSGALWPFPSWSLPDIVSIPSGWLAPSIRENVLGLRTTRSVHARWAPTLSGAQRSCVESPAIPLVTPIGTSLFELGRLALASRTLSAAPLGPWLLYAFRYSEDRLFDMSRFLIGIDLLELAWIRLYT